MGRALWMLTIFLAVGCGRRPSDDYAKIDVPPGPTLSGWTNVDLPSLGMTFSVPKEMAKVTMPLGAEQPKASAIHAYIDFGPPPVEIQIRTMNQGRTVMDVRFLTKVAKAYGLTRNVPLVGELRRESSAIGPRFVQEGSFRGQSAFLVFWIRSDRIAMAVYVGPVDVYRKFIETVRLKLVNPEGKDREPAEFIVTPQTPAPEPIQPPVIIYHQGPAESEDYPVAPRPPLPTDAYPPATQSEPPQEAPPNETAPEVTPEPPVEQPPVEQPPIEPPPQTTPPEGGQ